MSVISQNVSNVDENENQVEVENLNSQSDVEQGWWDGKETKQHKSKLKKRDFKSPFLPQLFIIQPCQE